MTGSSSDKLIEALRKAVSRTSMLAEGNDPELDPVLRQVRQNIMKGADADKVLELLREAEPFIIKSDEAQLNRAKQVRNTLHSLVDLLETQDKKSEKKKLEAQIRSDWQSPSKWPNLLKAFQNLAESTLNQTSEGADPEKSTLIKRIFDRRRNTDHSNNDQEVMMQISNTLAGLMNNLQLPSHYKDDVLALKKALLANNNLQELPKLLDEVIHFIMIIIGKTQESLTNYLNQLNKQLASINASVSTSYKSQQTLSESREGLNTELEMQVADTSKAVQDADSFDGLKNLINDRLSTISSTMSEYKTNMLEQEKQANQSITQLKNKVTRMEKDTTSLRSLLQEKLAQAMTDSLTDLPNRTAYQDTVHTLCEIMQKQKASLCLAVCDIDHFKRVNDTWGHLAGDKVLSIVPKQLHTALLKDDKIFRYGGEEFVIVFPNTTPEQAMARAEAARKAVEKTPFNMQGEPVSISISIGIAQLGADENPESLFSRADKQLYQAKESGRNKVLIEK